jgi:CO/xanthine dehydrogenase FAD-binding subunit
VGVIEYLRPTSVDEAVELLGSHGPDLLVMAGGTIAMPLVNDGIASPERVMSLRAAGIDGLRRDASGIRIGAACPLQRLVTLAEVPMLAEAARHTGSWAIRNMGTVGGNLFAPPPAGDVTVALLALDATLVLAGAGGRREMPLHAFHTGFMATALGVGELLVEVRVPLPAGATAFRKLGRRQASTPAVATVAARVLFDARGRVTEARLALGAVGPHPFRAVAAEQALLSSRLEPAAITKAVSAAIAATDPMTDGVATDWYRRRMTGFVVEGALRDIANRPGGGAA